MFGSHYVYALLLAAFRPLTVGLQLCLTTMTSVCVVELVAKEFTIANLNFKPDLGMAYTYFSKKSKQTRKMGLHIL